jgi:ureidoacrylate peracid hydrolase
MIKPIPGEMEVIKNCYSAFQDTKLDLYLKVQNKKTIICTGTATNVCVLCTSLQGFHKGYYTVFVMDCTSSSDPSIHEAVLKNHRSFFGHIATSGEIIACWER